VEGLPALSLDALTSVAYAPEAIIVVLVVAGAAALHLVLPVTIAVVALLGILVFSYLQVIDAYPGGGGACVVWRANLTRNWAPGSCQVTNPWKRRGLGRSVQYRRPRSRPPGRTTPS
jgi:hypothetical protein